MEGQASNEGTKNNNADQGGAKKSAGPPTARRSAGSFEKKRRKIKRNHDPIGFEEWPPTDREFYHQVSIMLRNWKATEKQCSATRRPISFWENWRLKKRAEMKAYKIEMDAFKKSNATFKQVPGNDPVDLP